MRGVKAFTLIELLTVVTIISILATVVYGVAQGARSRALNTAQKKLVQEMGKAVSVFQVSDELERVIVISDTDYTCPYTIAILRLPYFRANQCQSAPLPTTFGPFTGELQTAPISLAYPDVGEFTYPVRVTAPVSPTHRLTYLVFEDTTLVSKSPDAYRRLYNLGNDPARRCVTISGALRGETDGSRAFFWRNGQVASTTESDINITCTNPL